MILFICNIAVSFFMKFFCQYKNGKDMNFPSNSPWLAAKSI